jgi:hypothetical protein
MAEESLNQKDIWTDSLKTAQFYIQNTKTLDPVKGYWLCRRRFFIITR